MKKATLLTLSVLLLSFSLFSETGVLTEVQGSVEVMKSGSSSWEPAAENMEVNLNDTVATSFNSSANLKMGDNAVLLKPLSRMTIDKLIEGSGKKTTSLFLQVGACKANVDSSKNIKQDFKIVTPHSTASVRGTVFELTPTRLTVIEGSVAFYPGLSKRDRQTGGGDTEEQEDGEEEVNGVIVNQGESAVITIGTGGGSSSVNVEESTGGDVSVQTVPVGNENSSESSPENEGAAEGGLELNWIWGE